MENPKADRWDGFTELELCAINHALRSACRESYLGSIETWDALAAEVGESLERGSPKKDKAAQDLVQKRWDKTSAKEHSEFARKMAQKRWLSR